MKKHTTLLIPDVLFRFVYCYHTIAGLCGAFWIVPDVAAFCSRFACRFQFETVVVWNETENLGILTETKCYYVNTMIN